MIEFRHVDFSYEKDRPVLRDLSFRIEKGESVGLIGANGAGKSTVMKLLLGLLTPKSGEILVDGVPVGKKTLAEIGRSREEAERRVDAVLEKLGLQELKHRHNHRISGGEKRMAAIATILAMEPEAVLMDEPSSALDPCNRRLVINTIRELRQTKLITSHDLDMILDTCERVILLSGGAVAADGPADQILRDRALLEAHRMELPFCLAGK